MVAEVRGQVLSTFPSSGLSIPVISPTFSLTFPVSEVADLRDYPSSWSLFAVHCALSPLELLRFGTLKTRASEIIEDKNGVLPLVSVAEFPHGTRHHEQRRLRRHTACPLWLRSPRARPWAHLGWLYHALGGLYLLAQSCISQTHPSSSV
ncbi:hypothetical protein B0H11DRAFT_2039574 [Mycena galericulata]|nr:hypothetical protein B0H11DRAFT_2039574 [Mycena galericulata]